MNTTQKTMIGAIVALLAVTGMSGAGASLTNAASHAQLCRNGGAPAAPVAGANDLCVSASVEYCVAVVTCLIGTGSLISQPLGQTPVIFVMSGVILHNGVLGANGVVDFQGANSDEQQVYFCSNDGAVPPVSSDGCGLGAAGTVCTATNNAGAVVGDISVSGSYSSTIIGAGVRPMDYSIGSGAGEPYFVSEFLEFAYPSQVTSLTESVTVAGSCTAGTTGFDHSGLAGAAAAVASTNFGGLSDTVTYSGI